MKILLSFVTIFVFSQSFYGQNNIAYIKKLGSKYSAIEILKAINKADWCGYFHETSRYTLTFEDGATVELLSKKELNKEVIQNDECFQNENTRDNGIYKIHESGVLIRMLSARNTSKN